MPEDASVLSKSLVAVTPHPTPFGLGGKSLSLPNTTSILAVDDEVLPERAPSSCLGATRSGRQAYKVSVLTGINSQKLLNREGLTERQRASVLVPEDQFRPTPERERIQKAHIVP